MSDQDDKILRLDAEVESFYESVARAPQARAMDAGLELIGKAHGPALVAAPSAEYPAFHPRGELDDGAPELLDYKRRCERVLPLIDAVVNGLAEAVQVAREARDKPLTLQLCLTSIALAVLPTAGDARALLHGAEPLPRTPGAHRAHAVAITGPVQTSATAPVEEK